MRFVRSVVITTVVINSACYRGDSGHDRGGVLRGVAVVVVMVVVAVAITSDHHTARYGVACQEKCNEDLLKATSKNYINLYFR